MTYDVLARGALDYMPCRYGDSKLVFRGPKQDFSAPYVAFLGGTEFYGKFVQDPIPALVAQALNVGCANFGQSTAGVDLFLNDPFMLPACSEAEVTVLQVLGAGNLSNRMYTVHPRRNDRFVAPSESLRSLYPDVDFAEFHYTKHLLRHLSEVSDEQFQHVLDELEEAWIKRMQFMMSQIESTVVLLWVSPRPISDVPSDDAGMGQAQEPVFVSADMMDRVASYAKDLVEVVVSPDALRAGTDGMIFTELDAPAARNMLGPRAHEEVAEVLAPVLSRLMP